jgi:hypothetical protein
VQSGTQWINKKLLVFHLCNFPSLDSFSKLSIMWLDRIGRGSEKSCLIMDFCDQIVREKWDVVDQVAICHLDGRYVGALPRALAVVSIDCSVLVISHHTRRDKTSNHN